MWTKTRRRMTRITTDSRTTAQEIMIGGRRFENSGGLRLFRKHEDVVEYLQNDAENEILPPFEKKVNSILLSRT